MGGEKEIPPQIMALISEVTLTKGVGAGSAAQEASVPKVSLIIKPE